MAIFGCFGVGFWLVVCVIGFNAQLELSSSKAPPEPHEGVDSDFFSRLIETVHL